MGLQKYLIGHKILDVEIRVPKIFQGESKNVIGAKVINIKRIGKGLIIELDNNYSLAIHLKLTGQLIYRDKKVSEVSRVSKRAGGELPNKFTCVIFKLDSMGHSGDPALAGDSRIERKRSWTSQDDVIHNACLYYNDLRKFGWIKIIQSSKLKVQSYFTDIGPEPPVTEPAEGISILTLELFQEIISSANTPIKILLMDQKKIAGVGNIYANEALFYAGIDPRRRSGKLSNEEIKKLYDSILKVLKDGIKYGGSSDVNYVNALGEDGKYQEHFLVYGREGEKCMRCGGVIKKIFLGNRGTYFCPACQR